MHANPFNRHATSPYIRHRQATNYFQSHTTSPYYRSCEHVCKPLLSSHNVSLLSTSTGNQLCSPIIAHVNMYANHFHRHTINVSLLSISAGNQLFSASHNVSLLSLMLTCTQIAFLVTQPLLVIAHVNMEHCIVRQATSFSVWHRFPIIAHVKMHANCVYRHIISLHCRHRQATNYFRLQTSFPYYRSCEHACKPLVSSHNVSLLSTSTGNQLFSASHNVPLLSLISTCTQTAVIVTKRLLIIDINRQPTIFSATQRSPIIAHVNKHANSLFCHTSTSYHRSHHHKALLQQATNYFRRQTLFPYYRSREYSRE